MHLPTASSSPSPLPLESNGRGYAFGDAPWRLAGDYDSALERLTRLAASALRVSMAAFVVADRSGTYLRSSFGLPGDWNTPRHIMLELPFFKLGDEREPIEISKRPVTTKPEIANAMRQWRAHAFLGVPLPRTSNSLLGTLCVAHGEARRWSPEDVELLHDVAALIVMEAEAREQAQRAAQESRHAQELSRLIDERTRELSEMSAHLETVREEERRRLARDLHDDLGASLSVLRMDLGTLHQRLTAERSKWADRLGATLVHIDSAITVQRRAIRDLRPPDLDVFGLGAAVRSHTMDFADRIGVASDVIVPKDDFMLDDRRSIALFRVLQQALANVALHAKASHLVVALTEEGDNIVLAISDNGVGLPAADQTKAGAYGLRSMRERARQMGGALEIDSTPGHGTRVEIVIPRLKSPESK